MSEVVADRGDVVASVAFASDVEVAPSELGVSSDEAVEEGLDGSSDLLLGGIVVEDARAF